VEAAGQLASSLAAPVAALGDLVRAHSGTHTIRVAPDGVAVALTPIEYEPDPATATVVFLPDWRRPDSAFSRRGAYASMFSSAACYLAPLPGGKWERRFVQFEPAVKEWTIERDLRILSVGPQHRWVGWDGERLVLGLVEDGSLSIHSRLALPAGTSMGGFHEGVTWLHGGESLLVLATHREPAERGMVTDSGAVLFIDWATGSMRVEDAFAPYGELADDTVVGLRPGGEVGPGGYWATRVDRSGAAVFGPELRFHQNDTIARLSPTKRRALVRDRGAWGAVPPYRVRQTWPGERDVPLPGLPTKAGDPVGWLDTLPSGGGSP
jgi:hypothetical protein